VTAVIQRALVGEDGTLSRQQGSCSGVHQSLSSVNRSQRLIAQQLGQLSQTLLRQEGRAGPMLVEISVTDPAENPADMLAEGNAHCTAHLCTGHSSGGEV
jgi:hypothetical protein